MLSISCLLHQCVYLTLSITCSMIAVAPSFSQAVLLSGIPKDVITDTQRSCGESVPKSPWLSLKHPNVSIGASSISFTEVYFEEASKQTIAVVWDYFSPVDALCVMRIELNIERDSISLIERSFSDDDRINFDHKETAALKELIKLCKRFENSARHLSARFQNVYIEQAESGEVVGSSDATVDCSVVALNNSSSVRIELESSIIYLTQLGDMFFVREGRND